MVGSPNPNYCPATTFSQSSGQKREVYPQHPPPATPKVSQVPVRLHLPTQIRWHSQFDHLALVPLSCTRRDSVGNLNRLRKIGNSRLRAIPAGTDRILGSGRFFTLPCSESKTPAEKPLKFPSVPWWIPRRHPCLLSTFLAGTSGSFLFIRSIRNERLFFFFFETPLVTRFKAITINTVPPYDDFGDWATPKEPAAELFSPPFNTTPNAVLSLFIFLSASAAQIARCGSPAECVGCSAGESTSVKLADRSSARQAARVNKRKSKPQAHCTVLIHR